MQDLYQKPKSKKHQLLQYIKSVHYAKTSDVIRWGLDNFSNRAVRSAQDLCTVGNLKRISKEEKIFRFRNIKEDVFEFVHEENV